LEIEKENSALRFEVDRLQKRVELTQPKESIMLPHQERVVQERAELVDKLFRLKQFFSTPTFEALDTEEKGRLARQAEAMDQYAQILADRIHAFPQASAPR
jgi:regulator of replication initiation timing